MHRVNTCSLAKKMFHCRRDSLLHILRNPFLIGVFLIRVYHGMQGIFICGAQVKVMLDPLRIPFTPASFIPSITCSVYTFWPSHPCTDDLEAHLSTLRWTISFVESFMGALKSLGTTGSSPLLRLQELPLLATPYSIALSALADGLWSLICSSLIIYIYIYIYIF